MVVNAHHRIFSNATISEYGVVRGSDNMKKKYITETDSLRNKCECRQNMMATSHYKPKE